LAARLILFLSNQGGFQSLLNEALPNATDGIDADLDGFGDLVIQPCRSNRGSVRFEEDAGMDQFLSGGLTR
jgi:hypothetical protein